MSSTSPKIALFTHFAAVAKSLAHAHRLELLEQLVQGERSVEMLAQRTDLSVANASQDCAECHKCDLEKLFARAVVHAETSYVERL